MNHRRILIIDGHPDATSFGVALAEAYRDGATASDVEIETIRIRDLDFNPNLQ